MDRGPLPPAKPLAHIPESLSPDQMRQMLHDLRVRQAELEAENEELRAAQKPSGAAAILENISDAFFSINSDMVVTYFNHTAETALGRCSKEVVGFKLFDVFPEARGSIFEEQYTRALNERLQLSFETYFGVPPYENWYEVRVYPSPDGISVFFRVITEQKQARERLEAAHAKLDALRGISSLADATVKVVSDHILTSITRMTQSEYGFYGFVNEDESVMTIHAWSGEAMTDCSMAEKPTQFEVCTAGVWGEAIRCRSPLILNNYGAAHQGKKGLPEGHVPLSKLLVVPFFSRGRITAVAAVANRTTDYGQDDVDQITAFLVSVQAIAESKRTEEALVESQILMKSIVESTSDMIWAVDPEHFGLLSFNFGLSNYFLVHRGINIRVGDRPERLFPTEEFVKRWHEMYRRALREGPYTTEYEVYSGTNTLELSFNLLQRENTVFGISVFGKDITERKRAEEERARLETQLHQAQRMESVGHLAGGVAHDFNNMLQVILGNANLAMSQSMPGSQVYESLSEIHNSAQRSADLTRHLLAFARKQTIAPKLLDLNETVAGMLKMLQRLIGENIELDWQPGEGLWALNMDPSQIDQILANLCVNARDAIVDVGKICIETKNCVLDEDYCAEHSDVAPGEYVRLSVSDTGCGMDKETLVHIFEPFFTTKGVGEGTGLGLATVYGAVKQNNGYVNVYSEPGHGTTFAIYLPRHGGKAEQMRTDDSAKLNANGHETVLIVEDEPSVLKLTAMVLKEQGYTVLSALTPGDAIRLAREHAGEIHLLMTDVIMPEMNGREVARSLQSMYPNIKRLFMSGYTADIIASQGVVENGVHFIQKPFSAKSLAAKIREVLGSE